MKAETNPMKNKRDALIDGLTAYKLHLESRADAAETRADAIGEASCAYETATEATQTEAETKRLNRFCNLSTKAHYRATGLAHQAKDVEKLIESLIESVIPPYRRHGQR
jgi:hypothetical protein